MAQQVVTELVIDARSAAAGAAAYDAAMKKAEAAATRVLAVNDNAQAAIERSTVTMTQSAGRQAAAWNRVASAADPVVAATLALERATTAGNAAMAKGVATADQVASTLAVYRARLDAAAASSHRGTAATALNAGQVQNLTFQLNDMATMLASGQSPFVMLMQQGMQMTQIFGPGVGVGGALKATGAALVGFLTNPLTLAVVGLAAAAGAVSLLWDAVSSSGSAERALEEHKQLIEDIRDAYGEAGAAATSYATKSAQVLQFRTSSAVAENAAALSTALSDFARTYDPLFGAILVDFGKLNPMVHDFAQSIRDGTVDLAGFQRELAAIGNATDDIQTDEAVRQVLALIEPLIALEDQARQTAGATQLFAGTLVTLGNTGALRFADAFGDLDGLKSDLQGFIDAEARAAKTATEAAKALDGVTEVPLPRMRPEVDNIVQGLERAEGAAKNFATALVGGVTSGGSVLDALGSAISGLSSTLGQTLGNSVSGLIGGATTGIFGSILSGLGGGLVSSLVSGIGSLFDSIFGNDDAEREAEREQRRAERRLKAQERRDRIDQRREKLEQQEEARLAKREASARRVEGFQDRAYVAGLDTTTLEGRLAQFDLEAQREREDLARTAGKKYNKEIAALDAALAAERLQIQRDFNDDMIAEAKAAQDELNRVGKSIVEYIAGLNSGSNSPLSPAARLAAAQSTYASQLALAQGGNLDAQSSITGYADDLISAAREMYASSTAFFDVFNQVKADLLGLPAVQQSNDPVVQALTAVQVAIVGSVDLMRTTLNASILAGPAASATALAPLFDTIDVNASGGITLSEMQTALGTTNAVLTSIFTTLDADGDGQITKLELIRAQAAATALNTVGAAKDASLTSTTANLGVIKTNTSGAAKDTSLVSTNSNLGAINSNTTGAAKDQSLKATSGTTIPEAMTNMTTATTYLNQQAYNLTNLLTKLTKAVAKLPRQSGGMIPRYAEGGTVGNGTYDVDSVFARYAGGGDVMLAGGEFVTRATSVNAMTMPILDAINRTGRPASAASIVANDNGQYFADQNRVMLSIGRATVAAIERLEARMARVEAATVGVSRSVERKPVPKPATKVA